MKTKQKNKKVILENSSSTFEIQAVKSKPKNELQMDDKKIEKLDPDEDVKCKITNQYNTVTNQGNNVINLNADSKRIEDLGRLREKIEFILSMDAFSYMELDDREDLSTLLKYYKNILKDIFQLKEKMIEVLEITKGEK